MAISEKIKNQTAIILAKIAAANDLDEDYKNQLYDMISLTTTATNGISQEEKIQKMTEAMHQLTISQIDFITSINKHINKSLIESSKKIEAMINTTQQTIQTTIQNATISHCQSCKALRHAEDVEKKEAYQSIVNMTTNSSTTSDNITPKKAVTWSEFIQDTFSKVFLQPWVWIFLAIISISPYSVNIIQAIKDIFK